MKKQYILFFFFIALFAANSQAQDKMVLRGSVDTLQVKVIELGVNDIRYKTWPVDDNMPMMVEKKERIKKIIFENGTIMKFAEDEFSNLENYVNQRKMAIKMDMLSPVRKVFSGSFEYSLKPGMSAEIGVGVIGISSYDNFFYSFSESDGGFIRLGLKLIRTPDYYLKGMRYAHILKGGYLRPELIFLRHDNFGYSRDYWGNGSAPDKQVIKVTGYAFMLNFGKQWVFSNIFCVDLFTGIGIGKKKWDYYYNGNLVPSSGNNYLGSLTGFDVGGFGFANFSPESNSVALSYQAGLKIGLLIGGQAK